MQAEPSTPAWLDRELFPFRSRYLEVDGNRIHYIDEGSGPVLLCLHGNPTWSFVYRDIVRALTPYRRCIALDYPGFGLSTARPDFDFRPRSHRDVVSAFVDALGLDEMTLFVQDWGGPIGLGVAVRNPERVTGLVIANSWAWPVAGDPHFEYFSTLMGGRLGGWLIPNLNFFVNVLIPLGTRRTMLSRKVMTAYRRPFPTPDSRRPMHIFPREIIASRRYLEELEQSLTLLSHLPALILWGDRDFAFRSREREKFEQMFPNHHTHILQGAGHYVQEDAAAEIARTIRDWWKHESTAAETARADAGARA
ncbi:MAG: alpha/beta fold hydrolase [Candidatus Binatia bacterium]